MCSIEVIWIYSTNEFKVYLCWIENILQIVFFSVPGRKRGKPIDGLDVQSILDEASSGRPMRQSRRLAVQKMKEEDERKQIEEAMYRSLEDESKKVSSGTNLYYVIFLQKTLKFQKKRKKTHFLFVFSFLIIFEKYRPQISNTLDLD